MTARAGALAAVAGAALALAPAARPLELVPAPPAAPAQARPRSVLSRVERTEVRLGAPFTWEVEVVHPSDERLAMAPALDAPPFRGAAAGCRREPAGAGTDEVRTTCARRLALFDLGPHDLPEERLSVQTPRGEATLAVAGPRVTGIGLADPAAPPDALALRPLAPPVPLLVPTWAPALWALALAAALAAALVAGRAWRARARGRRAADDAPPEPPDARLERRLDALASARLAPREHYFELSAIVREWLRGVTGVPAPELTTAELADRLAADGDPRVNGPAVVAFLDAADLVKFAGEDASPERCAAAVAWARRLPATAAARGAADRAAIAEAGRGA